jgi:hypothetical protein
MSLDWEIGDIEDYENVCWNENEQTGEKNMSAITHSLIFSTIGIGINKITSENIYDFYNRSILIANVYGMPLNEFPEDGDIIRRNYTFEEIEQHIGLWTNASNISDKDFMKNMVKAQTRNQNDLKKIKR